MSLPLPRAGARRGVPRAHLHKDSWYFCPRLHRSNCKRLGSQGGDHREKEGARHCCCEELVLCLSPARFLSEGAAPTLSLTLMRSCGRDQGPSPTTCTYLASCGISAGATPSHPLKPHHRCHFREPFRDPCPLPLRQSSTCFPLKFLGLLWLVFHGLILPLLLYRQTLLGA